MTMLTFSENEVANLPYEINWKMTLHGIESFSVQILNTSRMQHCIRHVFSYCMQLMHSAKQWTLSFSKNQQ